MGGDERTEDPDVAAEPTRGTRHTAWHIAQEGFVAVVAPAMVGCSLRQPFDA